MSSDTCTVCGGKTHDYEDINTLYRDTRYWFCSDEHMKEFKGNPEHFV